MLLWKLAVKRNSWLQGALKHNSPSPTPKEVLASFLGYDVDKSHGCPGYGSERRGALTRGCCEAEIQCMVLQTSPIAATRYPQISHGASLRRRAPHGSVGFFAGTSRARAAAQNRSAKFSQEKAKPHRAEKQTPTHGSRKEKPRVCGPPFPSDAEQWRWHHRGCTAPVQLHACLSSGPSLPSLRWPGWISGLWQRRDLRGKASNFLSNFQFSCGESKNGLFPGCLPGQSQGSFQFKKSIFSAGNFNQLLLLFFQKRSFFCQTFPGGGGEGHSQQAAKVLLISCTYKMERVLPGGISGILFL